MSGEFRDLVPVEAVRAEMDAFDLGGAPESVPVAEARGRVLAERVEATIDVPGFDRAAMDGYAVQAADTVGADESDPVTLAVTGQVDAGEPPELAVEAGEAVTIATGGVMPEGADAVVVRERTDRRGDRVAIRTAVVPDQHVTAAGSDVAAGTRALGPGTRLTPRELGLLSALGRTTVEVRSAPTVGIVSTGGELVPPGEPLDPEAGQVHDVNTTTLHAAVEEAGGTVQRYPHVGDDHDDLERVLRAAATDCDLVLSSGSTSAGQMDVIHRVIEDAGDLLVHGVALKPGKPTLVGRFDGTAYVGLPGYPVSALMVFRTVVAPALRRAAGLPEPRTATREAELSRRERFDEGRRRLLPVGLVADADGATLAYPVDKGSGATTTMVEADGVVEVPESTAYLAAGEAVSVRLFSADLRIPTVLGVGETDPAFDRLLDRLVRPRYLAVGSREGARRLAAGTPDVCVTAGPVEPATDAPCLARWTREWGLAVDPTDSHDIDSPSALVSSGRGPLAVPAGSGLLASLAELLPADLGGATGDRAVAAALDGRVRTVHSPTSAARSVASGGSVAGLTLRATVERTELAFHSLGIQDVRAWAGRPGKPGVERLRGAIETDLAAVAADLPGYRVRAVDS